MDSVDSASNGVSNVDIKGKLLSLRLKKGQIDKAVKDKSSKTFPDNFSVTLFLLKPEDQSDNLLDYSLYSNVLSLENPLNTITGSACHPLHAQKTEKQFTVVPVTENGPLVQQPLKSRVRPLTGGSGASSSSATPSLKSVEQSSQDSAGEASEASEDERSDFEQNPKCNINNLNKMKTSHKTIRPQSNWV